MNPAPCIPPPPMELCLTNTYPTSAVLDILLLAIMWYTIRPPTATIVVPIRIAAMVTPAMAPSGNPPGSLGASSANKVLFEMSQTCVLN